MVKICLYGPESVGKSTLAIEISNLYAEAIYVPEVARDMLVTNDFDTEKIIEIGVNQTIAVQEAIKLNPKLIVCDTDLITTQIYSKLYLSQIPTQLMDLENEVQYDQYFFLDIDVPWVADGLRDLGDRRVEVKALFLKELEQRGINFVMVNGDWQNRKNIVMENLQTKFGLYPSNHDVKPLLMD